MFRADNPAMLDSRRRLILDTAQIKDLFVLAFLQRRTAAHCLFLFSHSRRDVLELRIFGSTEKQNPPNNVYPRGNKENDKEKSIASGISAAYLTRLEFSARAGWSFDLSSKREFVLTEVRGTRILERK